MTEALPKPDSLELAPLPLRDNAKEPAPAENRFFARLGVAPLSQAFEAKIAVHPGLNGSPIAPQEIPAQLARLLAQPLPGKTVAYIHVPFCRSHCLFCGFYRQKYSADDSRLFTDTLIDELKLWQNLQALQGGPVHALYLGGGTPTDLEARDLARLLKAAAQILPLANDCEITVEGRLSNFDARKMEACLNEGVNRFSLGVQSFNTHIRRCMGRLDDRQTVSRRLELLLSYDQAAIIVDLIYGFPHQSLELWLEDIAAARSLKLDGLDCYQLNVYPKSPLGRAIERGLLPPAADLPGQSAMFAAGVKALERAFYRRLSLSHWARSFRERNLYNLYVKGSANCLAFGPGAGGNLRGHFYFNDSDYASWRRSVQAGFKPHAMMTRPRPNHYLLRAIAESLEQGWLDLAQLEHNFGVSVVELCRPLLEQWRQAALIELEEDRLVLTLAGQFWHTNLSQLLQEYLNMRQEQIQQVRL